MIRTLGRRSPRTLLKRLSISLTRHHGQPIAPVYVELTAPLLPQRQTPSRSASTKTRGEVAGSGKKIRPQKGSGRARLGDAQSPMLRGGGVAFGPKPRDFSTKLPRKVIDMGMRVALSLKVKENEFGVMSQMLWNLPKTGLLTKRLEELRLSETLFVTGAEQVPEALKLAIRNIPKVTVMPVKELKVFDLLKWRRLVLDTQAVDALEHNLARQPPAPL
ncbi:ribosomal protein L4 domain-containing protein [Mucidula mucida]|nr:ribosomal protein L4 domain-containing protein [Mucidula mucida]